MIDIHHHHFRRAPRGAAGFDGAGGAVANLQEAHQARRLAAAGKGFVFAAQMREIRAGARAVFEQPRLAHPQIHDAVFIHQIIVDGLDETGVGLGVFVGRLRCLHLAGLVIDIEMALARPVDAISPVEAGIEPLRRIRRGHLHGQHVTQLVEEGARVFLGGEIAALPAPIAPRAGQPVEQLARIAFTAVALIFGKFFERLSVGERTPQP